MDTDIFMNIPQKGSTLIDVASTCYNYKMLKHGSIQNALQIANKVESSFQSAESTGLDILPLVLYLVISANTAFLDVSSITSKNQSINLWQKTD